MPNAAAPHSVGVITKPYFVIFAAFKESMILNLAQRSFKVIHFGGNRKPVYDFVRLCRPLIVTFALFCPVSDIYVKNCNDDADIGCRKQQKLVYRIFTCKFSVSSLQCHDLLTLQRRDQKFTCENTMH